MKKQKTLNRLAAVAAVLLTLCLVFMAPVGAATHEVSDEAGLATAVTSAVDGDTILFLSDIEQKDGITLTSKKLTIDLNGKTFTVTEGASTNSRNFKIDGTSEVTIKNGVMFAKGDYSSGAYGTIRTEGTAKVTLTDLKLYNYRGNGLNIKALGGTTITISNTEIYSQYGGGIEAAGGTVELTNVKVDQKGMYTAPYNSMAISVNGGGKAIVHSGTYTTECITAEEANGQGSSHGPWAAGVLNSGGTLIINDGTFSNDNFGDNSLATNARGLILADTGANIEINGGTFNALKSIIDIQNNLGDASKNPMAVVYGGTFSANPISGNYANSLIKLADCYVNTESEGRWVVSADLDKAEAKIDNRHYSSLSNAVKAAEAGDTVTLLKDIKLTESLVISKSVTIDGKKSDTENHKISTSESQNLIKVTNDGNSEIKVTIQNVNLESTYTGAARIINVLNDNVNLNLNNALLDASATGKTASYTQVLNCGHVNSQGSSYENVIFNLDTVNIKAPTGGYAIFSVNPFTLDIKNSEISGYTALYFKTIDKLSANGAKVTIADSTLTSTNYNLYVEGGKNQNAFGTMVFEATDISVTLESGTTLEAESTDGYCRQAIFHFNENGYSDVSDGWYEIELIPGNTHVTVNNGVTLLTKGPNANIEQTGHGEDPLTINDINKFMSFENGVITNTDTLSAFLGNEQILESTADSMYKVVAKTYELTATTTKVGFDSVKVGYTQPEPQPVTIKNAGNVPVTINKPTYENFDVIDFPANAEIEEGKELSFKIQPKAGLAVGNYGTTLEVTNTNNEKTTFEVSFLVYQPSSGGSSKPVEEPEEPVVEPEVPTEEPEAGEATVETEVTDGGEVELETPTAGGSAAADEDEAKITGVVLPTGTDSEVTFVPVSEQAAPAGKETQTKKVFEINVPTYEKGKPATIKFTMTVAELEADGKEAADVALWHFDEETGEWTKLVTSYTIVDGVVYFEAITNDFSPFAIVYEDEPVDEPVDEPETPASPTPVLGLIAALGAAVVLRRK